MSALFIATTLGFGGLFVALGSLPSYAVHQGIGPATAGALNSVLLGSTVLVQTVVGRMSRRIGFAATLILGLLALGLPGPLYLASDTPAWLMAVSAVRGGGFGLVAVQCSLLAARVAPPGRLAATLGVYGLGIAAANLMFTPLGTALTAAGQFRWVALASMLPVLAVPAALAAVRATRAVAVPPAQPGSRDARRAIGRSAGPAVVLAAVTFAGGGLVAYLPIARSSGELATIALLVFGLTGGLSRYGAGRFVERFSLRSALAGGVVITALGLALLSAALAAGTSAAAGTAVVISAGLFGLGFGAVQNLTLLVTFTRMDHAMATTASAVWNGAFDAGTSLGSFAVSAAASSALGFPWTMALCGVVVLASVPLTQGHRMGHPVRGA